MALTPKMKNSIVVIEKALGLTYKGKTFEDALKFIGTYIDKAKEIDLWEKEPPTTKQRDAIRLCEETMGVEFTGSTKRDAFNYLNTYLTDAVLIINNEVEGY